MKNICCFSLATMISILATGVLFAQTDVASGNCKIKFEPREYQGVYFVNGTEYRGKSTIRLTSNGTYRLGIIAKELPNGGINFTVSNKCKITSVSNPNVVYFKEKNIYFNSVPNFNSDLSGWWRGEDNAYDSSPSNRNGTIDGQIKYVPGKIGKAFEITQPIGPLSPNAVLIDNPTNNQILQTSRGTVSLWINWGNQTSDDIAIFGGCTSPSGGCAGRVTIP